jgi:hypothetical protein
MAKQSASITKVEKGKVRRPGVHAKTRHSNSKKSKHYKKAYAGQGR